MATARPKAPREGRQNLLATRWDDDRRRVYAEYLARAQAVHDCELAIRIADEQIRYPRAYLEKLEVEVEESKRDAFFAFWVEQAKKDREEARSKLRPLKEQLGLLEAEIELMAPTMTHLSGMLMRIMTDDSKRFRESRKAFLQAARRDLQVQDWPTIAQAKRAKEPANARSRENVTSRVTSEAVPTESAKSEAEETH